MTLSPDSGLHRSRRATFIERRGVPRQQMATTFKTLIAAAMLVIALGTSLAGASDQPTGQKSNSPAAATRILETRQATESPVIDMLASPSALAHWVDEQRGRHVAIGLTIFR